MSKKKNLATVVPLREGDLCEAVKLLRGEVFAYANVKLLRGEVVHCAVKSSLHKISVLWTVKLLVICLAGLGVIFLLDKSDIAPVGRSGILFACSLPTREAHITTEGNITRKVHITRRRRIELAHLP